MSLGCLFTTGLGGASLSLESLVSLELASLEARASDRAADRALTLPCRTFSGDVRGCDGGCCGGGKRGASVLICPFGVPEKDEVIVRTLQRCFCL